MSRSSGPLARGNEASEARKRDAGHGRRETRVFVRMINDLITDI